MPSWKLTPFRRRSFSFAHLSGSTLCTWVLHPGALWKGQSWPQPRTTESTDSSVLKSVAQGCESRLMNPNLRIPLWRAEASHVGPGFTRDGRTEMRKADKTSKSWDYLPATLKIPPPFQFLPQLSLMCAHLDSPPPSEVWGTSHESRNGCSPYMSFPFLEQNGLQSHCGCLGRGQEKAIPSWALLNQIQKQKIPAPNMLRKHLAR